MKIVSRGEIRATAPFDMHLTMFRATQDAGYICLVEYPTSKPDTANFPTSQPPDTTI